MSTLTNQELDKWELLASERPGNISDMHRAWSEMHPALTKACQVLRAAAEPVAAGEGAADAAIKYLDIQLKMQEEWYEANPEKGGEEKRGYITGLRTAIRAIKDEVQIAALTTRATPATPAAGEAVESQVYVADGVVVVLRSEEHHESGPCLCCGGKLHAYCYYIKAGSAHGNDFERLISKVSHQGNEGKTVRITLEVSDLPLPAAPTT